MQLVDMSVYSLLIYRFLSPLFLPIATYFVEETVIGFVVSTVWILMIVSQWCHLTCFSLVFPCISYKFVIRFRDLLRLRFDFVALLHTKFC